MKVIDSNTLSVLKQIREEILYLSTKKSLSEENASQYGVRAKTAREYKREVIKILDKYIKS